MGHYTNTDIDKDMDENTNTDIGKDINTDTNTDIPGVPKKYAHLVDPSSKNIA